MIFTRKMRQAISKLHAAPHLLFIYYTGVTGGLPQWLWNPAGASATLLGANFVYAQESQDEILWAQPDSYASELTALQLAAAAREEGQRLAIKRNLFDKPIIGVGITGAVSTNRARRGENRSHIAVLQGAKVYLQTCVFDKAIGSQVQRDALREKSGWVTDYSALNMILQVAGVNPLRTPDLLVGETEMGKTTFWNSLERSAIDLPSTYIDDPMNKILWPDGTVQNLTDGVDEGKYLLFPGSFSPLHYGHTDMARLIEAQTGRKVIFHICGTHPEKGDVPKADLLDRVSQFRYRWPVLVTKGYGLYVEKAELFPGMPMLIGADAVLALLNPKYYSDGAMGVRHALERFVDLGTRFYVVGREIDGMFYTRDDLPIPPRFAPIFMDVSCRNDISSSLIRSKQG